MHTHLYTNTRVFNIRRNGGLKRDKISKVFTMVPGKSFVSIKISVKYQLGFLLGFSTNSST